MEPERYNWVGHCYRPLQNNDKIYMVCIRKESNPGAMDTWTVIAKWGRRGKSMSIQPKGTFSFELLARQSQMNIQNEQLKKGYMDIESQEYFRYMGSMTVYPKIEPLTMDTPYIKANLEAEESQDTDGTGQKDVICIC